MGRGQSSPDPTLGLFKHPPTSVPAGRPALGFGATGEMTLVPAPQVTPAPLCALGLRPCCKIYGAAQTGIGPGSGRGSAVSIWFYHPCPSYPLPRTGASSNLLSSPQIDAPSV